MEKKIGSDGTYFIASSLGGMVREFVWQGIPIIYPERKVGEKSRGGIPICFPFFGKSPAAFSGIPQHGWLRHQELSCREESENHVIFRGSNEPSKQYPWLLEYEVRVSIDPEKGLDLALGVTRFPNGPLGPAPINIGFHPYFSNLGQSIAVVSQKDLAEEFHKESRKVPLNDVIFINNGKWIIRMKTGGDFNEKSCVTLWSDDAEKYFCVEPVQTYPDRFDNPEGGKFLREGQRLEVSCSIEPTDQLS